MTNAGRDVESINEEARQAARDAVVREHHELFRAAQRVVGVTPVPVEALSERTLRLKHQQLDPLADAALTAALPLLRLSDVPGLERQLRDKIAGEIEAKRAEHFAEFGNEESGPRNYDWALTHAARIARGESS